MEDCRASLKWSISRILNVRDWLTGEGCTKYRNQYVITQRQSHYENMQGVCSDREEEKAEK